LNAVLGFSEIIQAEMFGPLGSDQYIHYSKGIHDSARHLLGIINDILDVSSIEAGDRRLSEELLEPAQVCQSAMALLRGRAQSASIRLMLSVDGDVGRLRADRRMVLQILVNLLSNAIKFSQPKASVTIHVARTPEGGMRFDVSDTGIGISADDLKRVMMPFEQVEDAYARSRDGVGLGLPLVSSMAELHEARFQLESKIDKGTTATITFPPQRCEPASSPPAQQPITSPDTAESDGSRPRSTAAF
jgi:signal transduction histidine kinase